MLDITSVEFSFEGDPVDGFAVGVKVMHRNGRSEEMKNLEKLRREAAAIAAATDHTKVFVDTTEIYSKDVTNGSSNCSSGNCGSRGCQA